MSTFLAISSNNMMACAVGVGTVINTSILKLSFPITTRLNSGIRVSKMDEKCPETFKMPLKRILVFSGNKRNFFVWLEYCPEKQKHDIIASISQKGAGTGFSCPLSEYFPEPLGSLPPSCFHQEFHS